MEEWPFNEKSLWDSLRPGQKWAVIIGVPINVLLFKAYAGIVVLVGNRLVEGFLLFFGFFVVPWVYARGLGLVIGVVIELLFYGKGRR